MLFPLRCSSSITPCKDKMEILPSQKCQLGQGGTRHSVAPCLAAVGVDTEGRTCSSSRCCSGSGGCG